MTGAWGVLGSDLASVLSKNHSVVGVGRRPATHLEIPFFVENLAMAKATRALVEKEKPDIILHCAAMTEVELSESHRRQAVEENFETTRNVTESAKRLDCLVIFFSTDFVFDGTKREPYVETDEPHPLSVYGKTKWLAERYLRLRGKRFLILRTAWLYGKQGDNFPKKVLRQAEIGKPLRVVSDQIGSPTFTRDLAGAVGEIVTSLAGKRERENQIYHLTNEGSVSRSEFARAVLKRRNLSLDLVIPIRTEEANFQAARPGNSVLSCEKVKESFGIRLRPWEEALDAYFKETLPIGSSQ